MVRANEGGESPGVRRGDIQGNLAKKSTNHADDPKKGDVDTGPKGSRKMVNLPRGQRKRWGTGKEKKPENWGNRKSGGTRAPGPMSGTGRGFKGAPAACAIPIILAATRHKAGA